MLALGCGGSDAEPPAEDPPAADCATGERRAEDESCLGPGVAPDGCAEGFAYDDGGCTAILPAAPCAFGTHAVPGDTECHEVGSCGAPPWGDLPIDETTQHVDATFGGTSDGSANAPWVTIQDAVDAATPGALVAIAPGSYQEDVSISGKPVRLRGLCASEVNLEGSGVQFGAIEVGEGASNTEIAGIAVTGAGAGIAVPGAESVLISEVWVHDTGIHGVHVESYLGPAAARLELSLVEAAGEVGVLAFSGAVTVEASSVRDARPAQDGAKGEGISAIVRDGGGASIVELRRSIVERSHHAGVRVLASKVTVDGSVVRGTTPQESDGEGGWGFIVQDADEGAELAVLRSVVEQNVEVGVGVQGAQATIESTVIRDTLPGGALGWGRGVDAQDNPQTGRRATLTLRSSLVQRSLGGGVVLSGTDTLIESSAVRDTAPHEPGKAFGHGISAQFATVIDLRDAAISGSHGVGVFIGDAGATLDNVLVEGTLAQVSDGKIGDGIAALTDGAPATMVVTRSLVRNSARAGISIFGASLDLGQTRIDCNKIDLDGETYQRTPFAIADRGENVCGCGEATVECLVLSTNLEAPQALP